MPNAEKLEKVAALKERIEGSQALLLAEYRGLSVEDATELRRSLAEEARFSVVKNTLMQRAAGEAGIEALEQLLEGPTAVAFVTGDVVAAAKRVVEAAKRHPALVLKGAFMEGRVLTAAEAQSLATLESREVMLSTIAGLFKTEMSRAASMFQALQSRFVGVLDAYRAKLPGEVADAGGDAPAAETAPVETEGGPTAETGPEAETAEPSADGAPAEEPEAATEGAGGDETSEVDASANDANEEE